MEITIRPPRLEDAETICEVLRRSISEICAPDYGHDPSVLEEWLENKTTENIKTWLQSDSLVSMVAEVNGKVVGYSMLATSGKIMLLYVTPEVLHQGAGKQLLARMEENAKSLDLSELRVVSTITARAFYERNGFTKDGEPRLVGTILGGFPLSKLLERTGS